MIKLPALALFIGLALIGVSPRVVIGDGPDCPHQVPVAGSSCTLEPRFACTYTDAGATRICTCGPSRVWRCGALPRPPAH